MRVFGVFVTLLSLLVSGCASMSDVGKGMQLGSTATGYKDGGVLFVTGWVLEKIGGARENDSLNDELEQRVKAASAKWTKHITTESPGLTLYAKDISANPARTEESKVLSEGRAKARSEAETGQFTSAGKSVYLYYMRKYENEKWIVLRYLDKRVKSGGLDMWCHKNADACIVALRNEKVALPVVTDEGKAFQSILNGKTVGLGIFDAFKPDYDSLVCRGDFFSPIKSISYGGRTFADAVKSRFQEKLKYAGVESAKPGILITGHLKSFELSSWGTGSWEIVLELSSSNGKKMAVSETRSFETSISGQTACGNAKNALGPALDSLVKKAFKSPEFAGLVM